MQTLSQAEGRMFLGLPATSPSLVHNQATQILSLEQEATCLGPQWTLIQVCASGLCLCDWLVLHKVTAALMHNRKIG